MSTAAQSSPNGVLDFETVFNQSADLVLILDPGFKIVAQNAAHAAATLSTERALVGKNLFEAFPENPDHSGAEGLAPAARLAAQGAENARSRYTAAVPL